jgi:hypothetical protein
MAEKHADDCYPGDRCVECDGCDCGLIESTCTGPGCWSVDEYDQWRDENGISAEEGPYG